MAVWDKLFEKYRRQQRDNHVNPVAREEISDQQKFGQDALRKNPRLVTFDNAQNNIADIIDRGSVVSQFKTTTQLTDTQNYFGSLFSGLNAMPIFTNKAERIRQYRAMALYTECDFCLQELADDVIHDDEEGNFIKLTIPQDKTHLNEEKRKILDTLFKQFMEIFHFRDDGFNIVKRFLTDGEVCFENIINPKKPELGIIGVKYLPAEYYETLLNEDTAKTIGILFDKEKAVQDLKNVISNSCLGARSIFNAMITTQPGNLSFSNKNSIPILYPQLTYFSSGDTSPDGLITYPLIEKCKQAYHQLALMQDAAVILRVTRAPERLLFNISTGGQPDKVARPRIKQFMEELKSKKIVSSADFTGEGRGQDITQVYNPVTMLETYFFGKSNANDGTTVESVGSSADYEQIADIEFFMRRLFKQFKVPFSRYKMPENSMERDETISYEEYSMARMIIRIQRRFAMGFKRSFITHLKLLGLWKKYNLKEADLQIQFNTPILYDLYQQQKMITAKMDAYKAIVDQDEFSKSIAMKKILKMTDEEVEENYVALIKEKQYLAASDYFADLVSEDHYPLDIKSPLRLNGIDGEENKEEGGGNEEGGSEGGEDEEVGNEEPPTPEENTGDEESGNEVPSFGLGGGSEEGGEDSGNEEVPTP